MLSRRAVRGWRQTLVNQGALRTSRLALDRLRSKIAPARTEAVADPFAWAATAVHPFDVAYGVETSGLIWGEELAAGSPSDAWSTAYYGIAPSVFRAILAQVPGPLSQFTFVDFGSGKGRAVLLASQQPLRKVVGVEISKPLHAISEANLKSFPAAEVRASEIALLHMDATEYVFPSGPLLLFFYHPFCKPVLKQVMRNLQASLRAQPRPVYLIYVNPELKSVLSRTEPLELFSEGAVQMETEDWMADRIGSSTEEFAIFRSKELSGPAARAGMK